MSKEEKRRLQVSYIYAHNAKMILDKEYEAKWHAKVYKETNKERQEWRTSIQRQRNNKWKRIAVGYHSKIYTQVDGKTCLFEIIISNYIHTMLLQAIACKKRTPTAETRG